MNNKLYSSIIIPLIIIGFIFPEIRTYVLFALILIGVYSGWKDVRKKLNKAEGEEIQQALVPLILLMLFVVLFIISLFL